MHINVKISTQNEDNFFQNCLYSHCEGFFHATTQINTSAPRFNTYKHRSSENNNLDKVWQRSERSHLCQDISEERFLRQIVILTELYIFSPQCSTYCMFLPSFMMSYVLITGRVKMLGNFPPFTGNDTRYHKSRLLVLLLDVSLVYLKIRQKIQKWQIGICPRHTFVFT